MPETLYALFYDYPPDILERRAPHREAHLSRIRAWHEDGRIVMDGATGDPPSGALIVFRTGSPAEAEAFAADDPYVAAGLVLAHRVVPWSLVAP